MSDARDFIQDGPVLRNQYTEDDGLRALLRRLIPPDEFEELDRDLARFGARVVGDVCDAAREAEASPPRHVPYDAWGRRVDRIETSEGWRRLDTIAAEEGLVARAYERRLGAVSRIDQLARIYLFHPSSAVYSCPLAMTDGAARCLELHADGDPRLTSAFRRLTSRVPDEAWTSGQWMTERTGGSDISGTSTIARLTDGGWSLTGTKWFTSATTSQMALTLARIEGAPEGSAGLSLFAVELRDASGALRGIRVNRLKDKLGTRALPTAELTLDGAPAMLVGGMGQGVRKITAVLNITRVYNAVCAVAAMRRAIALAWDYANRRHAFGVRLAELPLHMETLAALQVELDGALQLVFHIASLLGRDECGRATDGEQALLRLLTPVAKLYTAKQAVQVTSEVLEAFGGAGYIEDTDIPRLLRDAQVLPIWEGTTNVLSLDILRALDRTAALAAWLDDVRCRVDAVAHGALRSSAEHVLAAARRIERCVTDVGEPMAAQAGARALAFSIARTHIAALLLEHAAWEARTSGGERGLIAAARWCAMELAPLVHADRRHRAGSRLLLRVDEPPSILAGEEPTEAEIDRESFQSGIARS